MTRISRWLLAQESEKLYWIHRREQVCKSKEHLELKKQEAAGILNRLNLYSDLDNDTSYLQVGQGPYDVINFLPGQCHGIDPLAQFYKRMYKESLNPKVFYVNGVGERLPNVSETFDVVVLNNVINHTHNPKAVITEAIRVIKKEGLIYIGIHVYSTIGFLLRKTLLRDLPHPHIYTKGSFMREVRCDKLEFLEVDYEMRCGKLQLPRYFFGLEARFYKLILKKND